MEKRCSQCGIVKNLSDFYADRIQKDGRRAACKVCKDEVNKKWQLENKDRTNECRRKRAARTDNARRKWKTANRDRVREQSRRASEKRRVTIKGKLSACMSCAINKSLRNGSKAGRHWEDLVGYTPLQLKKHLKRTFTPEMSWENYGSYWHIDHKTPVAAFNYESPEDVDFKRCWALRNLQPLEATKNMSKQAKVNRPFQPSLTVAL